MRHVIKKELLKTTFDRGDWALAIIKEGEVLRVDSISPSTLENQDNSELLKLAKSENSELWKVQFLSETAFSTYSKFNI